MSHPVDFQGKIKQENKPTLHLSQVSNKAGCMAHLAKSLLGLRENEEGRHDGMCLQFYLLGKVRQEDCLSLEVQGQLWRHNQISQLKKDQKFTIKAQSGRWMIK